MTLLIEFCRRPRLVLTAAGIVCSLIVYAYLQLRTHTDLHGRHDVKRSSEKSRSLTEQDKNESAQGGHDVMKVQSAGNFTERLTAFNAFLSSLRVEELQQRGSAAWQRPTASPLNVVWGRGSTDDYLQLLSNYNNVTTIALPWLTTNSCWSSLQDHSNLLIQTYYEWTADDRLCSWIETSSTSKMKSYGALYKRTCNRNISDTAQPLSLEPLFLKGTPIDLPNDSNYSYPGYFYTATPPYVFYMHIHRDAIVTELGDVITDGLKLVLDTCSHDTEPQLPSFDNLERIPLLDELYAVHQYWGTGVFHRMVEIVPRLALHLQFLKANPEIRILAPELGGRLAELLEVIGLDRSRLVTGLTRAKIVYQPRATRCGTANVQESQVLSQLYRDYIERTFPSQPRNRLILIRRSRSRRFTEQKAIEGVLQSAARDYNLTYTLFVDNPTPSLNDTMMMFHSAVVIVAPHGAGLSNMFFSQPGTYVVEGVCNLPHVNLCFQWLAHILGHHWHGVTSRGGCEYVVDVASAAIDAQIKHYLHLWTVSDLHGS